jgi:hypothetical protein
MAIFQVDIQKNLYGVFITNMYNVNVATIEDAIGAGVSIANLEARLLPPDFKIDFYRVSTPAEGDDVFASVPVNIPGTRSTLGTQVMPYFNRFRVDMSQGFRRPLRKFLLLMLEGDQEAGNLTAAALEMVNIQYASPLVALGYVCGPTGVIITTAACKGPVGMRQLRRASKRKTPVLA